MTALIRPGIYVGTLRHRRRSPVMHEFRYPLFMVLLDIDRIPELMGISRTTSHNRWNWASFHDADHFGDPSLPLRERLAREAISRGIRLPDGPIYLLTHLRYVGYVFNPVSFFYCYDRHGALRVVVAEVNNTFGGAHNYWLEPERPGTRVFRARAAKSMYVSPFIAPDVRYAFALSEPRERLTAHVAVLPAGGDEPPLFDATLTLRHRPWNAREIRRALVQHPAMTAAVMAGIHWEALRLWWKGVRTIPPSATHDVYPEQAAPHAGRP